MSRPFKLNDTPTAPFSLRETGPLKLTEIAKRLGGATYRTARGAKADGRATVDPTPCPHCRSLVEWATTGKRNAKGGFDRYVYARCRGHKQHRWSFAGEQVSPTPPTASQIDTALMNVPPPPRPSVGANLMGEWIAARIVALEAELAKLHTIETLAQEVTGRVNMLGMRPPKPSHDGHAQH